MLKLSELKSLSEFRGDHWYFAFLEQPKPPHRDELLTLTSDQLPEQLLAQRRKRYGNFKCVSFGIKVLSKGAWDLSSPRRLSPGLCHLAHCDSSQSGAAGGE